MRISRALTVAAAWLLATAPPAASDAQWTRHVSEADRFEATFPGPVETSPQQLDDELRTLADAATDYISDDPRRLFMVSVTVMKDGTFDLHQAAEAAMDGFNCKARSRDAEVTISGRSGREIGGGQCELGRSMLMRAVTRGRRLYQVIGFVSEDADLAMAERFVSSFALLPE